jgi:RNA polymerase sigma factor (sigma-70 family)
MLPCMQSARLKAGEHKLPRAALLEKKAGRRPRLTVVTETIRKTSVSRSELPYLRALALSKKPALEREEERGIFRIYSRARAAMKTQEKKVEEAAQREGEAKAAGRSARFLGALHEETGECRRRLRLFGETKKLCEIIVLNGVMGLTCKNINMFLRPSSIGYDDLLQEVRAKLIENAMPKFSLERNTRFSTFAMWWVRHAISRYIEDNSCQIRHPSYTYEDQGKVNRAKRAHYNRFGAEPDESELAAMTGISRSRIRRLETAPYTVSLEMKLKKGEKRELIEVLTDHTVPNAEERLGELELAGPLVHRLLSVLSPRELYVISKRKGLGGGTEETLKDVGDAQGGISRERVRQIELRAIRKMRKKAKRLMSDNFALKERYLAEAAESGKAGENGK